MKTKNFPTIFSNWNATVRIQNNRYKVLQKVAVSTNNKRRSLNYAKI